MEDGRISSDHAAFTATSSDGLLPEMRSFRHDMGSSQPLWLPGVGDSQPGAPESGCLRFVGISLPTFSGKETAIFQGNGVNLRNTTEKPMSGFSSFESNGSATQRIEVLREQVQRIRSQKNALMKDIVDLQQQNKNLSEIFKRSLLHLMSMLKPLADPRTSEALDGLKNHLLSDTDWNVIDREIQQIKTWSLHEACAAGHTGDAGGSSKPVTAPTAPIPLLPDFLTAHRTVMDCLRCDFGDAYREKWQDVSTRLDKCQSFDDLLVGTRLLADLARQFAESITIERSRVAQFFTEIGQDLVEMETMLHVTVRHTQEAREANEVFSATLDGQMQEMRDSVNITRTLEELKSVVESKLATIKKFLKEKREHDEARHRAAGQNTEALHQALKKMKHEISTMQEKTRILEQQAVQDPLTGIHNRRAFDARLQEEIHRFQRYGQVFSLLVIDLDRFKQVNDVYGHPTGDQCLKEVTRRMAAVLRKSDFLARYGGEEFAVILPGIQKDGAKSVAEKLRLCVEKTRFLYQGERIPLTISVGISQIETKEETAESLFQRADIALYEAKRQGRNRVVVAE